jgi:LysM repeat protein
MKLLLQISLFFLSFFVLAQIEEKPKPEEKPKQTVHQYIEQYSSLAVEEMYRSKIPASITLAQGILESGNGNSRLSKEANNHFGIKCKASWTGPSIYEDDDAPQECFRKYATAADSYRDHSDFLLKNKRYAFLFDLDSKDYKAWAYGLKKAGYATNPQYPELLINFIEKHGLHKFDEAKATELELKENAEEKAAIVRTYGKEIIVNGVNAVTCKADDSYTQIALNYNLKVFQLYKYNDLLKDAECKSGDTVFLKPKKNKAEIDTYTFAAGDNMHLISQRFGIKLEKVLQRNGLVLDQQPKVGEILYLNSKNPNKVAMSDPTVLKDSISIVKTQVSATQVKVDTLVMNELVYENPEKNIETMFPTNTVLYDSFENKRSELSFFHTVQAGETLYSISKKYNIRTDALQFLNALNGNQIITGQKLIINPNLPSADTKEPQPLVGIHIVRQGETLFSISKMYNISIDDLKAINTLSGDGIKIDDRILVVPSKNDIPTNNNVTDTVPAFYYTVEKGETLFAISRKFNVSIATLKTLNPQISEQINVGDKLRIR